MAKACRQEVDLLGTTIEYEVQHSDEATEPRIDVDIRGVTVVVPAEDDAQPAELLRDNAAWVLEKQRNFETYREQVPDRTFEPGEQFPYLGKDRNLVVESRSEHTVTDEAIRLRQSTVDQSSVKDVLEAFYRRKARERFTRLAEDYAEAMGVEYDGIEIRNQRTKWGSCSTRGRIGLNWRLLMAPPEISEYIVVHELAHLREANHTDSFWQLVREHDPGYKRHARWLEEHSAELMFSNEDL